MYITDEPPGTGPANLPAQTDAFLPGSQQYCEAPDNEEGNNIHLSERARRVDTEMGHGNQTSVVEPDDSLQVQKRHTYPAGGQQQ